MNTFALTEKFNYLKLYKVLLAMGRIQTHKM